MHVCEREYLSGSNLLEIGAIFVQVGRSTMVVVRMYLVRVREIVFSGSREICSQSIESRQCCEILLNYVEI